MKTRFKTRFNSYNEFLNEGIEDIFRGAHAAIDPDDLVPIQDVLDRPKFPTQEQFDEVVDFLKADPEHFFYDSSNMLHPFIYWKGPVFHAFFGGLNIEAMKMMKDDKRLEYHQSRAEKDLKANDYVALFTHMDKKVLIPNFIEMYKEIPDNQKYDVFIDLYVRSEYGFSMFPKSLINDLFSKRKLSSEWSSRMREFKKVAKLNPKGLIRIYRGENKQSAGQEEAYSWTLSRKTAEFFANRFSRGSGNVISKMIDPKDILDYIDDRSESEVLVLPTKYLKEGAATWYYNLDDDHPTMAIFSKEEPVIFILDYRGGVYAIFNDKAKKDRTAPTEWFFIDKDSNMQIKDRTFGDERGIFMHLNYIFKNYTSISLSGEMPSYNPAHDEMEVLMKDPDFKGWWESCKEKYKTYMQAKNIELL